MPRFIVYLNWARTHGRKLYSVVAEERSGALLKVIATIPEIMSVIFESIEDSAEFAVVGADAGDGSTLTEEDVSAIRKAYRDIDPEETTYSQYIARPIVELPPRLRWFVLKEEFDQSREFDGQWFCEDADSIEQIA